MKDKKTGKKKKLELIRLVCPCGKRVKVSYKFAGKTGTCPQCGAAVPIPSLETIKKEILKAKKAKKQKEQDKVKKKAADDEDIDFDIPSLPSLKEIVLENSSVEDMIDVPMSGKVGGEMDSQVTEELLMDPDASEIDTTDIESLKTPGLDPGSINLEDESSQLK